MKTLKQKRLERFAGLIEEGKIRSGIKSNDQLIDAMKMERSRFYRLKRKHFSDLTISELIDMANLLMWEPDEIFQIVGSTYFGRR